MSTFELTAADAEWMRDLGAADQAYRALSAPWTWEGVNLYLIRDGEHGYVEHTGAAAIPTVRVPEGPIRAFSYNDLDQLVEAGWRIDDE